MDIKTIVGAAVAVFLAEIGDKTQLVAFGASASTRRALETFIGALAGFAVATAIAVMLGNAAAGAVPKSVIQRVGGVAFILVGALLLVRPAS